MYEMEKEMCEAIAKYVPFLAEDIFTEWEVFHSFDVILRAVDFARVFGIASIHEATNHLVAEYIRDQRSGLTRRALDSASVPPVAGWKPSGNVQPGKDTEESPSQ